MLDDLNPSAGQASSGDEQRCTLLLGAVFGALLRAAGLTTAAGYTLGQVMRRHDGPALLDGLAGWGGFAALAALASVVWLELALVQMWPRAGLPLNAAWSLAALAVGSAAAATGGVAWLIPTAIVALPPLSTLLRRRAWRLERIAWRRPSATHAVHMTTVHGVAGVAVAGLWAGPVTAAVGVGLAMLVAVIISWLLVAAGFGPPWLQSATVQPALLVGLQLAVFVATLLFVISAVV